MFKKVIFVLILSLLLVSCFGKNKEKIESLPNSDESKMSATYKEAMEGIENGEYLFASRKFTEAETLEPQSIWAPRAALMSAYALYNINFYPEAVSNLERFISTYPKDKNIPYAHYLIAICFFEQILDEKKDLSPLLITKKKFEFIIKNFPDTDYALDGQYKLDLIIDQLASKEMYIGRYYMKNEKWIPAINRFKTVVNDYDKTIYIEEALHRLVEIYYRIGLIEEAQKAASTLGYNYKSGEWYKKSYKVFNKSYKPRQLGQKKKDGFIKRKLKTLFE